MTRTPAARTPSGRRGGREGSGERRTQLAILGGILVFLVLTYGVSLFALRPAAPGRQVSLNEFNDAVRARNVTQITLLSVDNRLAGTGPGGQVWTGLLGEIQATEAARTFAAKRGLRTRVDSQSGKRTLGIATTFALPAATLIVGFAFLFVIFRGLATGEIAVFGRSRPRRYVSGSVERVTFADVAGQDEAVAELREIKDFLAAPERFEATGAVAPKGVLLLGPPGCGKTLLARAVAGEAGVPFFSISATEFVEMLVGVGASRIRDLFRQAREAAPSIVFIDEIDAIGRARTSSHNEERESSLNELLVQLDGFDEVDRVMLMAATNRADMLDSALVRKGRFDRHIVIDQPDLTGRIAIFQIHARAKPLGADVDLEVAARRTVGFSGAEIANVLNEAALLTARRGQRAISRSAIEEATDRVHAGVARPSRVLGDDDKRRIAVHEAGHAVVGWVVNRLGTIDKVSIVARGDNLGLTWRTLREDRQLSTRSELESEIACHLAGRAAEQLVYGEIGTAAGEDLRRATNIARDMVCDFGMSDVIGPRVIEDRAFDDASGARSAGSALSEQADQEISRLLHEAERRSREVLVTYRGQVDRLAELLIERETIERDELERILEGLVKDLPDATLSA
jgi:cell division protease FtsH